jgi:hypothetical protein
MSFSRYATDDSVISAETVVRGLWSGDSNTLASFFTGSNPTEYYVDVYQVDPSSITASVQFDIQYGHLYGSGSLPINTTLASLGGYTPSRIVYGQYRNLVYGTEDTNFSFDGGVTTARQIYVINVSRERYKQALHPGSFNITLKSGSSTIFLTDDSNTTSLTRFLGENRVFYIISGSNGSGSISTYYGMMLPDIGVVILDASGSLTPYIQAAGLTTASRQDNHLKLLNSIVSGSVTSSFKLQSEEVISSRYFFTRIKNSEFNYTTNPSIIDTSGNLLYNTLINNPQTYITTVGMYNDNNELLAVAKLSKPLVKDFTKEALIRIKLDY